ncbi:MAG TPA: hypothetical protein VJB69_03010 [Candidatus Paceibacterota bacterium]
MSRLKSSWPLGMKAGDLVYVRSVDYQLARVIEFIPELANEFYAGQIPIVYLREPEKHGIVWIPVDDLVTVSIPPED